MCIYFEHDYTMWKVVQTIGILEDDEIDVQEEGFEDATNPCISS